MLISYKLWAPATSLLLAGSSTLAYGVMHPTSQLFGRSVYRGFGNRKSIALTFDDGPSDGSLELLDYLAQQNISATFFQCGMNVIRHPGISQRIRDAGHEIGNHTYSHARLCPQFSSNLNLRSPTNIHKELALTQMIIKEVTGATPSLFRAPYGLRWFGLDTAQKKLHLLGVLWTVIAHDWQWPSQTISRHLETNTVPGAILCLHDGRDVQTNPNISEMLMALRIFVPWAKGEGYTFETVSQLLLP